MSHEAGRFQVWQVVAFVSIVCLLMMLVPSRALGQVCSEAVVLRSGTCPAGVTTCTTKGSALTYAELDASLINLVNICNDLAAGGGNNSFTTINAPSGTDPVADSTSDTLNLTCSGGLGCTGNSTTDTLDLVISTAPALAANGGNCSAGQWAAGVTAAGVAEGCTADDDTPDADSEVPNAITLNGGTVAGSNTLTGTLTTSGLLNEGGQSSVGSTPHFLGIADGSSATPTSDPQPTVVFQRTSSSTTNSIPFQFTYTQKSGIGYHFPLHSWVRNNAPAVHDIVAVSGSVYADPENIVTGVNATPSASGGSLATNTYSYYVAAVVGGNEIVGSEHVDAAVTGPNGSVALTWSALTGATVYRVYRYVPGSPNTTPVYFETASTALTDTGAAGTGGTGLSQTLWGLWSRNEKVKDSSRLAGLEIDMFNTSGRDAGTRVDRSSSSLAIQLLSAGDADNSVGIDFVGEADAQFHRGIIFRANAFDEIGIDFSDFNAVTPAMRTANNQPVVAMNQAGTANVESWKVGTTNMLNLAGSAVTVDPGNQRLGIVTTSPDERFEIETADNAESVALVENSNAAGTGAIAVVRSKADTAQVSMLAHGSGRTASRFGVTVGGYGELLQTTGNGLLVGTSTAVPMIFGTAATARLTIDANGNFTMGAAYIDIPQMTTPSNNPASGTRRLFVDSDDGKLKVRTSAGTSVSLEEQGTGGTTQAFGTIDAPSGTDPVADSAPDTLTLTCSGGGISCTGTAGTDTLDLSVGGGRSLTCASGSCDADAELYEQTKCTTIETPASGDDFLFYRVERAATVTGIDCLVVGGTSVAMVVKECDSSGASCGNTEASITCGTTNTTESSGIDDAAWDAGDWVRVDPGTVTGSVTQLSVCVTYQVAD